MSEFWNDGIFFSVPWCPQVNGNPAFVLIAEAHTEGYHVREYDPESGFYFTVGSFADHLMREAFGLLERLSRQALH